MIVLPYIVKKEEFIDRFSIISFGKERSLTCNLNVINLIVNRTFYRFRRSRYMLIYIFILLIDAPVIYIAFFTFV